MSENPFSPENLIPTWTQANEILKGDTPGHPFRGNQYSFNHGASTLANQAKKVGAVTYQSGHTGTATEHGNIASGHREVAKAIEDGMRYGKIPVSRWDVARKAVEAHQFASNQHLNASGAHAKVAQLELKPATGSKISQNRMTTAENDASTASQNASAASDLAERLTQEI
jgi:hypothetical protein